MTELCDKYKPVSFHEVVGNTKEVGLLYAYVKKKDISHILLYGPTGTGKSVCAHLVAKYRLGKHFRTHFKELNASNDRGIGVVRDKIKYFAMLKPPGSQKKKILYLSEVDEMTPAAQNALRRILELYNDNFEVIMSCNYPGEIGLSYALSLCSIRF